MFEKEFVNKSNSENYLGIRRELVHIIKQMIEKLKFTDQTLFQAILFMDILVYKLKEDFDNKFKIVAVSCLILAGL